MANSVIVKLQLQDELTPELKEAQTELENLAKETLKLDANLKELKANKKGISKGTVDAKDIEGVSKLQKELKALSKQYQTAKGAKQKYIKTLMNDRELKITALINEEIKKKTILINKSRQAQALQTAKTDIALQKELQKRTKVTKAVKSETNAMKSNSTSRLKENAERRALGTTLVRQIRRLESMVVAYYALTSAYKSTFGAGVELNKQFQDMELGLTALTSAGVEVSQNGVLLDGAKKFQALQLVTKDTLNQIREAATKTPATFNEMVGFYQQAIGHAIKSNGAMGTSLDEISKNTIKLTQRMSNLGAAAGMEMYKVNEEIRSIMSGNASTDSLLAMMIFGSPAEANRAVREAKKTTGGLRDLLDKMLKPFDALAGVDSYTKSISKLKNEIQDVQREASKKVFERFNQTADEFTKYLHENSGLIAKSFEDMYVSAEKLVPIVYTLIKAFVAYKAVGIISEITATTVALTTEKRALIANNLIYDFSTKKVEKFESAQLLLNKAILANPYFAVTALIVADLDLVYEGYKKIMDIAKQGTVEVKKNAEAMDWSGKGFAFNMYAEKLATATETAYEKMVGYKKAYDKTQIKSYKLAYEHEKANYEKSLKELDKFLKAKDERILTKDETIKKQLEIKMKSSGVASDYKDSVKKINNLFSIINQQTKQYWEETEKKKAEQFKKDAEWAKALVDFENIDINKGLNNQKTKAKTKATFEDWGKTLNSSISNSIVDALQSGDVEGALKGLGSSISSSMIQSSTANLVNSATQPSPSETAVSGGATGAAFGGVWGLLAGAGIGYITGVLTSDGPKSNEQLKQEYFAKIDKQTNSIVTALEKQTKILGQFGDDLSALIKTYDASRETFLGSEKKLNSSTQFIYESTNGHKTTADPLNRYMGVENNAIAKARFILTTNLNDFKKELFNTVGDTEKNGAKTAAKRIYAHFYAQLPAFKASVNDYISSMLDVKDSYTNLSDSLKSVYNNLNDGYYEAQKLKNAQKEVNSIVGNNTLSDYLKNTITGLDSFGTSISKLKDDLTSEDFLTQLDALQKLEAITGKSFDNNTAEALNYLDSIQLVGDAMATSNANIKSWEDSFKTEREIAQDLASTLHVTLATSLSSLSDLFQQLSTDADGLTDSDLKLLNANKKLLADNNKALDTAYLGQYSPLTMLQKADYANNVAYNASGSDIQTQIQASYQALQIAAQTATTDEQIRPAFDRYAILLEQQTADSTRTDIVNEIMKSNEKLTDVIDRLERLEQAS